MPDLAERPDRALQWCLTVRGLSAGAETDEEACAEEGMGWSAVFGCSVSVRWGRTQQRLNLRRLLLVRVCVLSHAGECFSASVYFSASVLGGKWRIISHCLPS